MRVKGGAHPVAGRLDQTPAMRFNGSTQQYIVAGQRVRHALGLLFPLLGATLDVGEQEGRDASLHVQVAVDALVSAIERQ